MGLALTYNLSFSDTLKVTLENISDVFRFEIKNGEIVCNNPIITDYSQIESLVKDVYKNVTGNENLPDIIVTSKEKMKQIVNISSNINPNGKFPEILIRDKHLLYLEERDLNYIMTTVAHGLGHYSSQSRADGTLEGRIIEEAKAISVDGAWSEELSNYIFAEKDGKTRGVILGKIDPDKNSSPELYVSDQIVLAIKETKKCTFKEVYKTILNSSNEMLISMVQDDPVYIGLKDGMIKPTAYVKF
jgi:hypothetical protein